MATKSRMRCFRLIGLQATLMFAATAQAANIDPEVAAAAAKGEPVEVLITLRGADPRLNELDGRPFATKVADASARLRHTAEVSQVEVIDLLRQRAIAHRSYWLVNAIWARVDAATLAVLAQHSSIDSIDGNPTLRQALPLAMPSAQKAIMAIEWGVARVNAPALWARGFRGQGVVIGGQDTGYQWNHPALLNSYRGWDGSVANHHHHWFDAIHALIGAGSNPCGINATTPCDDNNHGTHTMGTMVGDDGGSNQIGVAPAARWIGCRNMERGNGTPATYLECLQWFLAPTDLAGNNPNPSLAPHIINNSWGCPPSEGCNTVGILEDAVNNLRAAGILVVVSAGNSGPGCGSIDTAPSPYPASFTVGSTNSADGIASSSSRGPATVDGVSLLTKPDISAPGVSIRSSTRGGSYGNSSGTSMAGPHVAGVAALLMSARPDLRGNPAAVEALLRASARPQTSTQTCGSLLGSAIPNAVFGHGIVDAERAFIQLGFGFRDGFEGPP